MPCREHHLLFLPCCIVAYITKLLIRQTIEFKRIPSCEVPRLRSHDRRIASRAGTDERRIQSLRAFRRAGPGPYRQNVFLIKPLFLHRTRAYLLRMGPEGRKSNTLYHWVLWTLFPCFLDILPKKVFLMKPDFLHRIRPYEGARV